MRTKQMLAPLAMCCAAAALVGCASNYHQMSKSSMDEQNLERDEAASSTGLFQPASLDERAFRKPDLDTNGAVTLNEWQHFDANAGAKENLRPLNENEDGQFNATGFLTKAPKHFELYPVFGDAEQIGNNHFYWDQQEFQPQGLQLFSIRL
jgi:hypothetical protein